MRIADIPKQALVTLIRAYQHAVSPFLPRACRYVPTCSEYAIEAIDRHGILLGATRAGWRLLRCHPFARGGFDPVPLTGEVSSAHGGDGARIECGVPAARNHSTAHPSITH